MSAEFGNGLQQNIDQSQQQVSFHFWSCQLTEANPRYHWEPENTNTSAAATGKSERPKRLTGRHVDQKGDHADTNGGGVKANEPASNGEQAKEPASNGEKAKELTGNGEKAKEPTGNGDEKTENGDQDDHNGQDANAVDADFMQHVLKVNACILGPKATGVHLIAVRTRCYRQTESDTCPIVCIDPDSQRTVCLGYEFVLDSQNEVTFELAEGAGPMWLTGLHQVRVHDPDGDGEADDAEIDEEAGSNVDCDDNGESDDFDVIDDSSRFRLAGVKIDEFDEDEEMSDADPDEDEGELADGCSDGSEDAEVGSKSRQKAKSATGKRSPITTAQLRRRKRRRLAKGDSDEEEAEDEDEGDCESTDV